MPLQFWLGFPEGIVITNYHFGMIRHAIIQRLSPDEKYLKELIVELEKLDDDDSLLVESMELKLWVKSVCEYWKWYARVSESYDVPIEELLDPPAVCLRPERDSQLNQFNKDGLLFMCYDLVRSRKVPLPIEDHHWSTTREVVCFPRLWRLSSPWWEVGRQPDTVKTA